MAKPSFNGSTPGCSGSGCHSFSHGILSATPLDNFQVSIQLSGVQSGEKVAGDLVNSSNTVVATNNGTHSNPFVLTAPGNGTYTIYGGYEEPSKRWDSAEITFEALGVEQVSSLPTVFKLYQNYPNPFNPVTRVVFETPRATEVSVQVISINGGWVSSLYAGQLPAGHHELTWQATDQSGRQLNTGLYLLRVTAGTESQTCKMLLLR